MTTKTKLIIDRNRVIGGSRRAGLLQLCAVLGERGNRACSCHWLRGRLEDEEME